MWRLTPLLLASVAVLVAACDGAKETSANAAANVCDGRAALKIASTANGTGTDFTRAADALDEASDAAPAEINTDLHVVAGAVGPYLELFADADGDYTQLAQNAEFRTRAARVGSDEVKQASRRVNAWFAEHCKS